VPSPRKCTIDAVFVEDADNGPVVSCEWCRTPIHEGEARLRFFAIAYHLGCWDASVEALIVPPRGRE
jgi:hypothetical protein